MFAVFGSVILRLSTVPYSSVQYRGLLKECLESVQLYYHYDRDGREKGVSSVLNILSEMCVHMEITHVKANVQECVYAYHTCLFIRVFLHATVVVSLYKTFIYLRLEASRRKRCFSTE